MGDGYQTIEERLAPAVRARKTRSAVTARIIGASYFALLLPSGTSSFVGFLMVALGGFVALPMLYGRRGPRSFASIAVLLIPVVGAVIAAVRLVVRAPAMVAVAVLFWAYPIMIASSDGASRFFWALVGGVLIWLALGHIPQLGRDPVSTVLFAVAFPLTLLLLIVALVLPFINGAVTADVDVDDGDLDDPSNGFWAEPEATDNAVPTEEAGLGPATSSETSVVEPIGVPSQESWPPPTTEVHDAAEVPEAMPTDSVGSDVLTEIEESEVVASGSHAAQDSELADVEEAHDARSQIADGLPTGADARVETDAVTGEMRISSGDSVTTWRPDSEAGGWSGKSFSDRGEPVWSSAETDPVTGEIRVRSGSATMIFRRDPISGDWVSRGVPVDVHLPPEVFER